MQGNLNRHVSKEDMSINTYMFNNIQNMMYCHFTPTRVTIIKQKQRVKWALMKTWKN